jgi:sulfur-carrier protein
MIEPNAAADAATITVFVPGLLRDRCDGADRLKMTVPDVRAALDQVEARYPSLYRSVCDETGAVRRHVNLFVNLDNIRDLRGLETPLARGDELIILPSVSGG